MTNVLGLVHSPNVWAMSRHLSRSAEPSHRRQQRRPARPYPTKSAVPAAAAREPARCRPAKTEQSLIRVALFLLRKTGRRQRQLPVGFPLEMSLLKVRLLS